jgi:predicted nucleic acid-binding protein
MIAFDTDVLTEVLLGNTTFVQRAAAIPVREQAVPVIVIEETFSDFRRLHILSLTPQAEALSQQWRQQGIRLATHDLRIAAICVAHTTKLISRNRQDFERVPGLIVEFWE